MTLGVIKISKRALIFLITLFIICTGCASSKISGIVYHKTDSSCDLAHLGKNKYYYSRSYQRRLIKSLRKFDRH